MKKIIIIFLIFCFSFAQANAFSFKRKKVNPVDVNEKLEYVNMDFWSRFNDPYLTYYICEAVKNNHDARKASWKVAEYRENVKYQFGQELPHLTVGANYAGIHVPKFDNFRLKTNAFVMPFMVNYEADLLLKNRDKTKAEKKAYEAEKYREKAVYIALAADVAAVYTNLLQYDYLIKTQEEVVKVKEEQLSREMKKFNRGVVNNVQLNLPKKELENAKNDLEALYKDQTQVLTQLCVLTGISPECACDLKRGTLEAFDYGCTIPSQVVSDVIFSRPDVMAAESDMEKAKIDIRVARKELLPRFNITGFYIFNTIAPGNFFSWKATLAYLLAGATQELFMGGMRLATLRKNKAIYEQLFENYRQTDLNAVKEVNDALCITKLDTKIDNNTIEYLKLQQNDYKNYQAKFARGVISYPELLAEHERLLNAEQGQAQTKTARIVNYFTLYKAVGGKL